MILLLTISHFEYSCVVVIQMNAYIEPIINNLVWML